MQDILKHKGPSMTEYIALESLTYAIGLQMCCQTLLLELRVIVMFPLGKLITCQSFMFPLPLEAQNSSIKGRPYITSCRRVSV